MASQARDKVEQIGSQARDQVTHYTGQAQHQAQEATDWFQQKLHQNPLAVGAAAVALGTVAGLALPETRMEDQLMGEARDGLMQQAKSTAQDTMHKVQHVAEETRKTAQEEAKKEGLTG